MTATLSFLPTDTSPQIENRRILSYKYLSSFFVFHGLIKWMKPPLKQYDPYIASKNNLCTGHSSIKSLPTYEPDFSDGKAWEAMGSMVLSRCPKNTFGVARR